MVFSTGAGFPWMTISPGGPETRADRPPGRAVRCEGRDSIVIIPEEARQASGPWATGGSPARAGCRARPHARGFPVLSSMPANAVRKSKPTSRSRPARALGRAISAPCGSRDGRGMQSDLGGCCTDWNPSKQRVAGSSPAGGAKAGVTIGARAATVQPRLDLLPAHAFRSVVALRC